MELRELDALISDKVMGFRYHQQGSCGFTGCFMCMGSCPRFSTDMTTAWKIVNAVHNLIHSRRDEFKRELRRLVSMQVGLAPGCLIHPDEIVLHLTPEMICLAALKAVGVSIE